MRGARLRSVLGRSLWGLAAIALVAAVVVYPLREVTADPPAPVLVDVPAGSTVLVCPGTVRLPTEPEAGEDVAYDPQFDTAPGESVAALGVLTARPSIGVAASRVLLETLSAERLDQVSPTTAAGGGWVEGSGADEAVVLRADAAGDLPAWLAGSVQVVTAEGDLRGLAAAACQYPTAESWLVGGGTELGSSARLVLANPGVTPASVTVRVWGPSGEAELAGAPEYLVPPRSERVVLLEGVAAEQRRIVVQVTSTGGAVAAFLQDSLLRGFVSAGIDQVVAGQGPSTRQVVPLSVTDSAADDLDVAQLRVLAPGEEPGTVAVTFLGSDGPVELPGTTRVSLDAGIVLDIPLGGLPAGEYLAVVEADVPIVAGALLTRGAGVGDTGAPPAPMDRAWAATVATGGGGPLALPPGAAGYLLLSVPDDDVRGTVVVEAIGAEGVLIAREYEVRGGRTLSVPLEELADAAEDVGSDGELVGLVVRSEPRLAWSVVLVSPDEEMVGVLTPVAPRPAAPQLGVHVR